MSKLTFGFLAISPFLCHLSEACLTLQQIQNAETLASVTPPTMWKVCRNLADNVFRCRLSTANCDVETEWEDIDVVKRHNYTSIQECTEALPKKSKICSSKSHNYCWCVDHLSECDSPNPYTIPPVEIGVDQCSFLCNTNKKTKRCLNPPLGCYCVNPSVAAADCPNPVEHATEAACTADCGDIYTGENFPANQ